MGEYFADLLVANTVIVERKAAKNLAPEHEAQLRNYLPPDSSMPATILVTGGAGFIGSHLRLWKNRAAIWYNLDTGVPFVVGQAECENYYECEANRQKQKE